MTRTRKQSTAVRAVGVAVAVSICIAIVGLRNASADVAAAGDVPAEPAVTVTDVLPYLHALQDVADRNGGNRAHGTQGFLESLHMVQRILDGAGYRTTVQEFTSNGTGYNLIADWPGGDDTHTVLLGAHLDSVPAGPGINDNGSGSAVVLATAVAVARAHLAPRRHLRFAWWGAEENGMVGSTEYLNRLPAQQVGQLTAYLNVDMTGVLSSGKWLVVDTGNGVAKPFYDHFAAHGRQTFDIGAGGSDGTPFDARGVPVSGFTTGLDDCYHQACDRVGNIAPDVEVEGANAMIHATWVLSTQSVTG